MAPEPDRCPVPLPRDIGLSCTLLGLILRMFMACGLILVLPFLVLNL